MLGGVALLYLSMWCLATLDASGKWAMAQGAPLVLVSWMRYVVHVVLVALLIVPLRGLSVLKPRQLRDQLLRGLVMLAATLMFFSTLRYLPQAEATAIVFLAPLLVLAAAPWVLKEPPRLSRWVAAGVGFAGVLIVIRPGSGLHPVGVLCGLVTACLFAGQFIATRRLAGENPFTTLLWSGGVGAVGMSLILPFTLASGLPAIARLGTLEWLVLVSTGISGGLGHLLQIQAYRNAPASMLAPFAYLQITCAATLGWLIWSHFPGPLTWLGIGITCGSGVVIAVLEWRRQRAA
ncbi:DMT family transporter [Orrella sp. JC864]